MIRSPRRLPPGCGTSAATTPGSPGTRAPRLRLPRSRRRADRRFCDAQPHQGAGDPAGVDRCVDLPLAQRPHPGDRARRPRAQPIIAITSAGVRPATRRNTATCLTGFLVAHACEMTEGIGDVDCTRRSFRRRPARPDFRQASLPGGSRSGPRCQRQNGPGSSASERLLA